MRKFAFIPLLCILLACEDGSNDIVENVIGSMDAQISTTAWKADAPIAVVTDTAIVVSGISLDETTIALTALGTTVGTYSFKPTDVQGSAVYRLKQDTGNVFYGAVRGSMTITDIDAQGKKVSGTFYFDGYKNSTDSVQITSGQFNKVNYTGG